MQEIRGGYWFAGDIGVVDFEVCFEEGKGEKGIRWTLMLRWGLNRRKDRRGCLSTAQIT
ncbi:MAG: hypothetical protein JRH08_11135 [Deltaproteobacteria bacterium]|nr:hypothetical protein [Deltaproteobacteria bacterium]MBW1931278.1 hypothetical protein [Deltaproteobacteria bacterium]MBW2026409.1 hypothetical protein [Deltaproteobacteria bacterium]MBW2126228.1 hypothetical protein [Deltaproteobacteria bacterium]